MEEEQKKETKSKLDGAKLRKALKMMKEKQNIGDRRRKNRRAIRVK